MKAWYLYFCITTFLPTLCMFENIQLMDKNVYITNCTLFGIHIAQQIETTITALEEKIGLVKKNIKQNKKPIKELSTQLNELLQEHAIVQDYFRAVQYDIISNSKYDEVEKQRAYKIRAVFARRSKPPVYISQFVWDLQIQNLKKSNDVDCVIATEKDIEKINFYYAALILAHITQERRELHIKAAMKSFKKSN